MRILPNGMYYCPGCKRDDLVADDFGYDRSSKHKLTTYCKECSRKKEDARRKDYTGRRDEREHYRRLNPDKRLDAWLRRTYNTTLVEFRAKEQDQGGVCAICGREPVQYKGDQWTKPRLYQDHDHTTGQVRGLLCHHCNTAIGHLRDDPQLLLNAIEYLSKYK